MRNWAVVLLLALLLAGCSGGNGETFVGPIEPIAGETVVVEMRYDGLVRSFRLFVPAGTDPAGTDPAGTDAATPAPLLLVLHGLGDSGLAIQSDSRFESLAAEAGLVVVYPNGFEASWNAGSCCGESQSRGINEVGFLVAVVEAVQSVVAIDPARVYATGFSNGGMMAHKLACERPDVFAAVAAVSGTLNEIGCAPGAPVSILHIHGTADGVVPYEGGSPGLVGLQQYQLVSVFDTVTFWADQYGCAFDPDNRSEDGYSRSVYVDCEGAAVEAITVLGGGHNWPERNPALADADPMFAVAGSEVIWAFLAAHPKE